jgi:hypothetical protein
MMIIIIMMGYERILGAVNGGISGKRKGKDIEG